MFKQMNSLAISPRLLAKMKSGKKSPQRVRAGMDTSTSTVTSDSTDRAEIPIHFHANILSECNLNSFWKDIKRGVYDSLKNIKFSFTIKPHTDLSKMKHLVDVFSALGKLPYLQEVEFCEATLFVPGLVKLFKKTTSLKMLKFHHCRFVLSSKSKRESISLEKLWEGIRLQTNLTVLEFVACSCSQYQPMSNDSSAELGEKQSSFDVPAFLQEQELTKLRRLVLDQFCLESSSFSSFEKLVTNNASLEELEIHPLFETGTTRRRKYQAKKAAIRKFLQEGIPAALAASKNSRLSKLVVSIEDYHLDPVYEDTIVQWICLLRDDNHTLTDMRLTKHSLGSSSKEQDNIYGLERDAWLHCNLQYQLRLNQLMADGKVAPTQINKEFLEEILPEAYDVSCLHHLLQTNPNLMDASTQSVPCTDEDVAEFLGSRRSSIC